MDVSGTYSKLRKPVKKMDVPLAVLIKGFYEVVQRQEKLYVCTNFKMLYLF